MLSLVVAESKSAVLHDSIEDNKAITYEFLWNSGIPERVIAAIRCLTKVPGETQEEYELKVLSNKDAIKVKKEDLLHNSDLKRLKGITEKDIERSVKYMKFFWRLSNES